MEVLKDLLKIGADDAYDMYGVFLTEREAGGHSNYDALLMPPKMKPYTAVNYRDEDGERLPEELIPRYEARDVTLHFALLADSKAEWIERYDAFLERMKAGWVELTLTELNKTYRLYVKEFGSYEQLTPLNGKIVSRFSINFREPQPDVTLKTKQDGNIDNI
ncbi:hypothetical protein D0T50_09785 [Bacteroides sp. 214]|uniref:hypothetical protein n=1 Tax=Bacteroides sp. 214 TaxID=2302935 RepID=UPI0013D5E4C7|nr:hypothetical protein [Bacteroides sp. 214]NDW13184.1 hypothetical protein [Bacteroides sp. 214]